MGVRLVRGVGDSVRTTTLVGVGEAVQTQVAVVEQKGLRQKPDDLPVSL